MKSVATLATLISVALAAIPRPRTIFNPPVLDPNSETVWIIGTRRNVTWDASNPPEFITGGSLIALVKGSLILTSGPGSLEQPLAKGFDPLNGFQEVTVPDVEPGNDYQIVLFGGSGNWGPVFSITN